MAEVRYRALKIGWIRAGMGCVVGFSSLFVLGAGAMLLTLDSVAGVLGAGVCLMVVLFSLTAMLIGTRLQFTVDDEGLTLVHYVRSHRIRWEEVAVIQQTADHWTAGAAVVVLKEPLGRRITALATTDRMAVYRGENFFRWGSPATELRAPTRAAIEAHQRWLANSSR